ncbi:MAG: hypothetical protein WA656_17985 [Pseudolabrys sp.]
MLKKFASSCAAIIVVTAVSIPTQARVVRVSGDHVGNLTGTRVVAANGSIYRSGVWRGQYRHNGYRYGRYAYGYRPYWRLGAAGAAGVAAGAYAYDNGYGYTYDNGNGYGMTYQGGPRSPYYQRSYGYDSLYRNWTEF